MKKIFFTILIIFSSIANSYSVDQLKADRLAILFDSLSICESDSQKTIFNKNITCLFDSILQDPTSFEEPFLKLNHTGKIYSDDHKIRIYTWSFLFSDKTFGYGGFIQSKEGNNIETTPLKIKGDAYLPNTAKKISNDNWYGSLYYKAIHVKKRKGDYYVLLGWSGNNAASDFKIIETISFDKEGTLTFGKDVFENDKKKNDSRVILEFSADGKVTLTYDETLQRIIFDHLIPIEPIYTGIRSYYGPDFTYDAYTMGKGTWIFEENIDARNP